MLPLHRLCFGPGSGQVCSDAGHIAHQVLEFVLGLAARLGRGGQSGDFLLAGRFGTQPRLQHLALIPGGGRPLPGLGAHAGVDVEVEELAQHLLAVPRLVVQELGEPALGQHHRLGEPVEVQAQHLLDRLAHLRRPSGQDVAAALQPGLLGGGPAGGAPHHPDRGVALAVHLEVEFHPGLSRELVDGRGHGPVVVVAGHRAEQGEGDAVDDGGLARSGRPHQSGQLHAGEVHLGVVAEGGEPLHPQLQRPHARSGSCEAFGSLTCAMSCVVPDASCAFRRVGRPVGLTLAPDWSVRRCRAPAWGVRWASHSLRLLLGV